MLLVLALVVVLFGVGLLVKSGPQSGSWSLMDIAAVAVMLLIVALVARKLLSLLNARSRRARNARSAPAVTGSRTQAPPAPSEVTAELGGPILEAEMATRLREELGRRLRVNEDAP